MNTTFYFFSTQLAQVGVFLNFLNSGRSPKWSKMGRPGDLRHLVSAPPHKHEGKAYAIKLCATSKGVAEQGGTQKRAPLRHLCHPLIGWPRWSSAARALWVDLVESTT